MSGRLPRMEPQSWDEVVAWIDDRWPKGWRPEQAVAYFDDLADFEAVDVWEAIHRFYERGSRFAPTGSELVSLARDIRREHARQDQYRGLPETRGEPIDFDAWKRSRGIKPGESGMDVIRRMHAERTDCQSKRCEIHNPEGAEQYAEAT